MACTRQSTLAPIGLTTLITLVQWWVLAAMSSAGILFISIGVPAGMFVWMYRLMQKQMRLVRFEGKERVIAYRGNTSTMLLPLQYYRCRCYLRLLLLLLVVAATADKVVWSHTTIVICRLRAKVWVSDCSFSRCSCELQFEFQFDCVRLVVLQIHCRRVPT